MICKLHINKDVKECVSKHNWNLSFNKVQNRCFKGKRMRKGRKIERSFEVLKTKPIKRETTVKKTFRN